MSDELKPFDFSLLDLTQDYSIFIDGSRTFGKSTFLQDLWENYIRGNFDLIIMFCDNPQGPAYKYFTEDERLFIFPQFVPEIIKQIDYFQSKTNNALKVIFIFDDCSSRKANKFNNQLQQLFIRGRNIRCSVVFSTQYPTFITKESRGNIDWLVQFGTIGPEMFEAVAQRFLWHVVTPKTQDGQRVSMKKSDRLDFLQEWMHKHLPRKHCVIVDFRNGGILYKYSTDITKLKVPPPTDNSQLKSNEPVPKQVEKRKVPESEDSLKTSRKKKKLPNQDVTK